MRRRGAGRFCIGLVVLVLLVGLGLVAEASGSSRTGSRGPINLSTVPTAVPESTSPPATTAPSTFPRKTTAPSTHPSNTTAPSTSPPTTVPLAVLAPTAPGELNGMTVTIDPGHNGDNWSDPSYINQMVWNGREEEPCDTAGTTTQDGYTESQFNVEVAQYLASDLQAEGASVVLTRTSNAGVGPCITQRASIGNDAHSNVAVSIHADGGPPDGRGFTVLEPVADGIHDAVIGASQQLGVDVRSGLLAAGMPFSDYDGTDGIEPRDDLGGLNLTTVPKVMIECGNMRNATDAALLVSSDWQQQAAHELASALSTFLIAPS